jgi:hypothetical protein
MKGIGVSIMSWARDFRGKVRKVTSSVGIRVKGVEFGV